MLIFARTLLNKVAYIKWTWQHWQ